MDPARWQRIKSILADALDQEDDAARAAAVERGCRGDPELRREVCSLLGQQTAGLERFADGAGALLGQHSCAGMHLGRRLGAYELTRELGRGGMGAVYLARRADGRFEQQVAVKLLKRGTDTEEVLRRFRAERRILARLEHPNIARLLDGGETDDGLPFFVMEHVDGVPLTTFAKTHGLSLDARLALFGKVCAAVQFAHQNLVVHRDLKPGNILVTPAGEPKLLDFGLARLVGGDDADATALEITVAEARRLTPAYASPEQVRGAALTTVSDVYSLGALLYELLTDQPPHRFSNPRPSPVELLRVVGEQEPIRPSLAATGTGTAPRLRGDLDNIVGLAMRKDPARRYQSAGALADDLRRHRESRPVRARRDTWRYRTGKFIGRNRVGVTVGTLTLLALVATSASALRQAARAERRFNDVRALAHTFLFDFHDSIRHLPGSTPARRLLVTSALDYLQRLERETGGDVGLRRELARAYIQVGDVQGQPNTGNLGDTRGALGSYRRAVALARALPDDDASAAVRADAWNALGSLLANAGADRDKALGWVKLALAAREKLARDAPDNAARQRDLAAALLSMGDTLAAGEISAWDQVAKRREATDFYEHALAVLDRLRARGPADPRDTLELSRVHYRLGNTYHIQGMQAHDDPALFRRGLDHHLRSLALREELAAAQPDSGQARRNLADGLTMKAQLQTQAGDPASALKDCRRGIALFTELAAADPTNFWAKQDLAFAHWCAANPLRALGDLAGATGELDQSAAMYDALAAADPASLLPVEHLNHIFRLRTEIRREAGDAAGETASVRRWLACAERLCAASPQDTAAQADRQRARDAATRTTVPTPSAVPEPGPGDGATTR